MINNNYLRRILFKYKYYRDLSLRNVGIAKHADLVGEENIEIGNCTLIGDYSILSTCSLLSHRRSFASSKGRIRIGNSCEIHRNTIIATYGGYVEIGNNVSLNPYSIVYGHGGVKIGDDTRIAAHVVIVSTNHNFRERNKLIRDQGLTSKGISIGNDVWIGTGVKILDGVSIGSGSIIAAGAIVRSDIEAYGIAAGIPAKIIGTR
jgi:acetyltransferase-like isoleucine patch superfamily enzyme